MLRERYAWRFAFTLVLLGLVLAVVGTGATLAVRDDVARTVRADFADQASQEAQKLAFWHETNENLLKSLAESEAVRSRDPAVVRPHLLSEIGRFDDRIRNVHYVNVSGGVVEASTRESLEGRRLDDIDAPWTNGSFAGANEVTTTGVYRPPNTTEGELLVAYVCTVGNGEQSQSDRLVVMTVSTAAYTEHFADHEDRRTMVVDESGRVVFAQQSQTTRQFEDDAPEEPVARARATGPETPGTMRMAATGLVAHSLRIDPGDPVVVGFDQVGDTGWVVLVQSPPSAAFALADGVTRLGVGLSVLGLALLGIVGLFIGVDTTMTIDRLTRATTAITNGDYDVDVPTDRDDEFGDLFAHFDTMATAMRDRERSLEARRDRLSGLFDNTSDCVVHVEFGHDGVVFRDVNPAFESTFGVDAADVDGSPVPDVLGTDVSVDLVAEMRRAILRGKAIERELSHPTADGHGEFLFRFVPVESESTANRSEGFGVFTDITARKTHTDALERYKTYMDQTLDAIDDVFYVVDEEGSLQQWNESLLEATGYSTEAVASMHVLDFFVEGHRDAVADAIDGVFETGVGRGEAPFQTADGELVPYEFVASRLTDPDGEQVIAGIARDVSERRARERDLQRTRDMLSQSQRLANVGAWEVPVEDGMFADPVWTDEMYRLHGLDPSEPLTMERVLETVHPDDRDHLRDVIREVVDRGESREFELRVERGDGDVRWAHTVAEPVFEDDQAGDTDGTDVAVSRVRGSMQDVTETRARQQELERYETIIEVAGDPVYALDAEGRFLFVNEAIERVAGYDPDELVGEHVSMVMSESDLAEAQELIRPALREDNQSTATFEMGLQTADGDVVSTENHMALLPSDDGRFRGTAGIVRDISERREMEAQLRERTRRFETLISNLPGMVYRCRNAPEWPMEFVSDGCQALTGYDADALTSGEVTWGEAVIHPADREDVWETIQEALADDSSYEITYRIETRDDETRWLWEQGRGVWDDEGEVEALEGFITDITERKERQRELEATTERLDTVVSNIPIILFAFDADGTFTVAEGDGLEKLGLEPGEVVGESVYDLYGDHVSVVDDIDRALEGETLTSTHEIGDVFFETTYQPVFDESGEVTNVIGVARDVTARTRHEAELERYRDLLERTQRLAKVGGWEMAVEDGVPTEGTWTEEPDQIHALPPEADPDFEEALEFVHPEYRPAVSDAVQRAIDDQQPSELEVPITTPDGEERWLRVDGEPVVEGGGSADADSEAADGEVVKLRGAIQDVTESKRYELALESLHEATRRLLQSETEAEIASVVVDIAEEIIDVPGVCIYLLDGAEGELVPVSFTPGFVDLCGGTPSIPVGEDRSPVWTAYVDGAKVDVTDGNPTPSALDGEVSNGRFVPLGDHGVFTAVTDGSTIDARTRQLIETLVATTEAAFDRLGSESALRDREDELAAQNRRLKRQMQITDIIRKIDQSLIDATSREEVEAAVCERLIESDVISFAWIGELGIDETELQPRAWGGDGQRYLDTVSLGEGSAEPAWVTATGNTSTVVENVVEGIQTEPWRKDALGFDFQSVISVPIRYDEYTYGMLTAYGSEPDDFSDLERSVFVELGETVGNTINAVQTKRALYADSVVELKLQFTGEESFLLGLSDATDSRVEFEGLAADAEEASRVFFRVTGADQETVSTSLERMVAVTDHRLITRTDDGGHFEATVTEGLLPTMLVAHGVSPRSMVAADGELSVVVDVSQDTDVREFVRLLQDRYPSAELLARRDIERSMQTEADLVESLLGALTERQREVLTTAYYSGFFEWPRETTGQEIAAMLDVSQPTVNRHLRLGQQTILTELFDGEYRPVVPSE
jgi:PAS domain S-box-containing protein